MLRFTAVGLREPLLGAPTHVNLNGFGLLVNGCVAPHAVATRTSLANTATLTFAAPATFDGVYLVTASASPELDPVVFIFESSLDGATWKPISTSFVHHRCGCSSGAVLPQDGALSQHTHRLHVLFPQQRGETVKIAFDRAECLRPYYWWTASELLISLVLLVAPVVTVVHEYDISVFDLSRPIRVLSYCSLVRGHTRARTRARARVNTHTHTHTHTNMYTRTLTHIHTRTHTHIHAHSFSLTHTHMHTYAHKHTHLHTHTLCYTYIRTHGARVTDAPVRCMSCIY